MEIRTVDHPLARVRLTTLRETDTDRAGFRRALRELTGLLVYEATRDTRLVEEPIRTPVAPTIGHRLANPPLLVAVLRAGLGMLSGALDVLPEAPTGFLGVARDEHTHQPHPYLESLPASLAGRAVLVLDPMLATGGSMAYTLDRLAERGATDVTVVCAVAAPEGLARLKACAPPPRLVIAAAVDDGLNETAFIVPGLGDAGDRQFGAV